MSTKRPWTKCPHDEVQHCPLYIASHGAGNGCDDGELGQGGCAVDRGMDYATAVEVIRTNAPGLVETAQWKEDVRAMTEQRARNMRAAGIH